MLARLHGGQGNHGRPGHQGPAASAAKGMVKWCPAQGRLVGDGVGQQLADPVLDAHGSASVLLVRRSAA